MSIYPFRNPDLPIEERLCDLLSRLSLDEKIAMLSTHQHAVERLGIGEWYVGTEVARGYVSHEADQPSTVLPQPIGMSSMFDPDLMEKLGEIAATEARIYNETRFKNTKLMLWGPTVDLCRDPRWGRNEEGYGEDPYLTGKASAAYVRGMRGNDPKYIRAIATLKHFCANNNEEDRESCSANIDPRTKHEYYYEPFRRATVEGGAYSMMAAYNELSGVPAVINPDIQSVVKDKWGLGFVVTDGGDFSQNVLMHHYSKSHAETLALCIKAGTDVMTDMEDIVTAAAKEALERGFITAADIDRAVGNSLRGRFLLGEFDPPERSPYSHTDPSLLCCDEYRSLTRQAAMESVTLLKNDGILPLDRSKIKKIAVIGPLAGKCYRDWYTGMNEHWIAPLDGIKSTFPEAEIAFDDGYDRILIRDCNGEFLKVGEDGNICTSECGNSPETEFIKYDWDSGETNLVSAANGMFLQEKGGYFCADSDTTFRWFVHEIIRSEDFDGHKLYKTWDKKDIFTEGGRLLSGKKTRMTDNRLFSEEIISDGIERAVNIAAAADIAVVFLGNDPLVVARECYDRHTLSLPPHQAELLRRVHEANPNTVLYIISSYPYAIPEEDEKIPAIVYMAHGGPEGGTAVGATLSGENNPAGRTPQTWYRSVNELTDIMDYDIINGERTYMYYNGQPLYPFGHGLSYSEFSYSGLEIKADGVNVKLSLEVENISERAGDEVAQIYFRCKNPRVKRPNKQLCGFKRVFLQPHEKRGLTFEITADELKFYDVTRENFAVEAGIYEFMAGASSEDIRLVGEVYIDGEKIPPRNLRKEIPAINYDSEKNCRMAFSKEFNRHYMTAGEDFDHRLTYCDADLNGITAIELMLSAPAGTSVLRIFADEKEIGSAKIPATASYHFGSVTVPLIQRTDKICDLTLSIDNAAVLSFKGI